MTATFRTSKTLGSVDPGKPHVILVGLPGAGKSTVGMLLATKLVRTFLDFDLEIERREGMPVTQIFGERGEPGFRELERKIALPEDVPYAAVEAAIRDAVGETLAGLVLFDRYAGANLGSGIKSLAIGLILQDRYRTLTDQDADRSVALAVSALESGCKAKLRG